MTAPVQATTDVAERRLSLYEITDELLALDDLLTETMGEVTPAIEEWMDEYGASLAGKVDNIGRYVASLTASADACKAEEARLAARRRMQDNKVRSLKRLLEVAMIRLDRPKLEGEKFTVARQKNDGKPALTVLASVDDLPVTLVRTIPATEVPDDAAIRATIAAVAAHGDEFLGVEECEDGSVVLYERMMDTPTASPTGVVMRDLARLSGPTYSVRIR